MTAALDVRCIATLAGKEFHDRLRNRWVLAVTVLLAAFALVIAYFGAAQQGEIGVRSLEVTIASLVSLAIYLVPLIALILGFDAVVGERERGSLDLLLSMPMTRLELLLGKYLGLAAALAASTLAGFGLVGALLWWVLPSASLYDYAGFVLSVVLLGLAFLSLSLMVSVFAADRTRASGAAIALWFFFVLVFDLLLLGALIAASGRAGNGLLAYLMLLDPADVFRVLNIFSFDQLRTIYGLATVMPPRLADTGVLGAVMGAWIVGPLAVAAWRFCR